MHWDMWKSTIQNLFSPDWVSTSKTCFPPPKKTFWQTAPRSEHMNPLGSPSAFVSLKICLQVYCSWVRWMYTPCNDTSIFERYGNSFSNHSRHSDLLHGNEWRMTSTWFCGISSTVCTCFLITVFRLASFALLDKVLKDFVCEIFFLVETGNRSKATPLCQAQCPWYQTYQLKSCT